MKHISRKNILIKNILVKFLLLVLMLIFQKNNLVSQQAVPCSTKQFPYRFCDGNGNVITKCSKNPNNEKMKRSNCGFRGE